MKIKDKDYAAKKKQDQAVRREIAKKMSKKERKAFYAAARVPTGTMHSSAFRTRKDYDRQASRLELRKLALSA